MLKREPKLLCAVAEIERDVDSVQAGCGEVQLQVVRRVDVDDRDPVARLDSQLRECVGKPVRAPRKPFERCRLAVECNRRAFGDDRGCDGQYIVRMQRSGLFWFCMTAGSQAIGTAIQRAAVPAPPPAGAVGSALHPRLVSRLPTPCLARAGYPTEAR